MPKIAKLSKQSQAAIARRGATIELHNTRNIPRRITYGLGCKEYADPVPDHRNWHNMLIFWDFMVPVEGLEPPTP